jgi:hypothetical protein
MTTGLGLKRPTALDADGHGIEDCLAKARDAQWEREIRCPVDDGGRKIDNEPSPDFEWRGMGLEIPKPYTAHTN